MNRVKTLFRKKEIDISLASHDVELSPTDEAPAFIVTSPDPVPAVPPTNTHSNTNAAQATKATTPSNNKSKTNENNAKAKR